MYFVHLKQNSLLRCYKSHLSKNNLNKGCESKNDLDKIKFVSIEARFDTPNTTGSNEQQSIPYGAFLAVKMNVKLNGTIIY